MSDAIHIYAFDGEGTQVLQLTAGVVPPVGAILQPSPPSERGWVVVSQRWQIRWQLQGGYIVDEVLLRVLPEDAQQTASTSDKVARESARIAALEEAARATCPACEAGKSVQHVGTFPESYVHPDPNPAVRGVICCAGCIRALLAASDSGNHAEPAETEVRP